MHTQERTNNENRLTPLAGLDDWKLEHKSQDVRGWPLRDSRGTAIGTVQEMLVDRDRERVAAVTLSDGSTVPVERISICDDHVELKSDGARPTGTTASGTGTGAEREERIPLVEEEIKIGKRSVETGGVRVHSRVVETPVHEEVRLRDETVEVERRPVRDREIKGENASALLRDREIEMKECDEEAVVAKEAIVKEELVVRKEANQRTETIEDTVRRTEVDVDKDAGGTDSRDRF